MYLSHLPLRATPLPSPDKVSCNCPQTHYLVKVELPTLLPLEVLGLQVCTFTLISLVLRSDSRALCMLRKHSSNWDTCFKEWKKMRLSWWINRSEMRSFREGNQHRGSFFWKVRSLSVQGHFEDPLLAERKLGYLERNKESQEADPLQHQWVI